MATFTTEEQEALRQLRQKINDLWSNLTDYQQNNHWLVQWLRDRQLHVGKTETVLRKSLQWREAKKLENLKEWMPPSIIEEKFQFQIPGVDQDGCIICVVPFGQWNVTELLAQGLHSDFLKFAEQMILNALGFLEANSTKDKFVGQCVLIFDCEGFTLTNVMSREALDLFMEILKMIYRNCPDVLKAAWVVNAPKYFEVLYAVFRPVLGARIVEKVNIHGYGGWREGLLETIDPDQLPSQYGGSNTTCSPHKIRQGYTILNKHETIPDSELIHLEIPAGTKHNFDYQLSMGGQMRWNFRTDDYDIGYAVQFKENRREEEEPEILFSCPKIDSHVHLQRGSVVAEKAGTCGF